MNKNDKILMNKSWTQMRSTLDKELPETKRRDRAIPWFWFAGAACVIFVGAFLRLRQISPAHSTPEPLSMTQIARTQDHRLMGEGKSAEPMQRHGSAKSEWPKAQQQAEVVDNHRTKSTLISKPKPSAIHNVVAAQDQDYQSMVFDKSNAHFNEKHTEAVVLQTDSQMGSTPVTGIDMHSHAVVLVPTLELSSPISSESEPNHSSQLVYHKTNAKSLEFGAFGQVGTHLLPLPSSYTLGLSLKSRLKPKIDLEAKAGVERFFSVRGNGTEVKLNTTELAGGFNPALSAQIAAASKSGANPIVERASYLNGFVFTHYKFNHRWALGAGLKYQYLLNMRLIQDASGRTFGNYTTGDIMQVYQTLADDTFTQSSLAFVSQLQYALSPHLSAQVSIQNLLLGKHPQQTSLQLGLNYSFCKM